MEDPKVNPHNYSLLMFYKSCQKQIEKRRASSTYISTCRKVEVGLILSFVQKLIQHGIKDLSVTPKTESSQRKQDETNEDVVRVDFLQMTDNTRNHSKNLQMELQEIKKCLQFKGNNYQIKERTIELERFLANHMSKKLYLEYVKN